MAVPPRKIRLCTQWCTQWCTHRAGGANECKWCRQSYLLGTQEVFDKRPPTFRTVTFPYAQCDRRPIVPESDPSRIPESCSLNSVTNGDSRGIVIGRWLQNNLMFCSFKFGLSPLRGCSCRWRFLGSWECAGRRGTCSGPLQGKSGCWFDCEAAPVHLEKQTLVNIT